MRNLLVRLLGWRVLIFTGDPCVHDRYRWARRHLLPGSRQVLDAGAGNGGIAIFAATRAERCLGLSFDAEEMASAKQGAELADIDNVDFQVLDLRRLDQATELKERFDQIICFEVAEHIVDDEKLFDDLAGALRPGGRLLLTTPFADHLPLYSEHLSEQEDGGHVRWGYSEKRLRELCEGSRLTPMEVGKVSGIVSQKLTDLQRRLSQVNRWLAWIVVFPLRPLQALDGRLTARARYPHLSITLTARKP